MLDKIIKLRKSNIVFLISLFIIKHFLIYQIEVKRAAQNKINAKKSPNISEIKDFIIILFVLFKMIFKGTIIKIININT